MSLDTIDEESSVSSRTRSSIAGSLTALSALTNIEDFEPILDPQTSTFVDEFTIDEDDPLWDIIATEEITQDDLMDIGGEDFIDIIQAFLRDKPDKLSTQKPDVEYKKYAPVDIPNGRKKITPLTNYPHLTGYLRLQSIRGSEDVFVTNSKNKVKVGLASNSKAFDFSIAPLDYFKIANTYSEEVGGKGVNLGFSSFFHSTAIMILAKNTIGVIEPHDGYDYAFDEYTFEVTGENWYKRESKADFVLNKYMLINAVMKDMPFQDLYTKWSWYEDVGMLNSFKGTCFDYEETERSKIVEEISNLMPQITRAQRSALGRNYLSFCSERPPIEKTRTTKNRDFTATKGKIIECIKSGAKEKNGAYYVPSPFRVLYPASEGYPLTTEEVYRRQSLMVHTTDYGKSTYHTWPIHEDPFPVIHSQTEWYPEKTSYPKGSVHDLLYQGYKRYKSFTSAVIQSALLPKINGKGGCFYDIYNRVGISWYRKSASSLSWYCVYYTFEHPGHMKEVGSWSFNTALGVHVSPTFKISRQDIHYAQMLPSKVAAALASCRPLVTPQEYRKAETSIMGSLCIQSNSTWATSHRTGANRFLTCCHLSESGDLPALMEGQLTYMKYHRFSDYLVLKYMLNYIDDTPPTDRTPFFRLPLALSSYEKDFSQTLQWHMRDTNHSTNCMKKVTEAAKRHKGEYSITNEWLMLQRDFIIKFMAEGASYREYKQLMLCAPNFPTLNLMMFIGMCSIVKDDIKDIGSVQHALGFSVWSMMTDRHCIEYSATATNNLPQLTTSKVVEAMSNYLRNIGGVTGGYELIAKMAGHSKLPPNYLLNHYKDAKESEREISQMYPQHRIKQCLPEVLIETFTGNNDADQMSDPLKYNKHVLDTMDPELKGKALHASEDRSKFCQEQEPQLQALAIAAISYESGSTSLRTAAAMTLMNKTRVVVYPHDADHASLLDGLDTGNAVVVSAKQKHFTKTITIEKNMTQGLGAVTAGAINTIYVTAQDKIITKLVEGLESKSVRTTSDDVKRSALYDGPYDKTSAAANYYFSPNRDLYMCMMLSNDKKFIPSWYLSEFNNVIATTTGMVPQSPIFATLCVQPLLSKSLFGDIVTVVNTSRSTMSWGCPPDAMEASLYSMIRVLRQKWLLNEEETETLWLSGFFPRSVSEHISGFWVRNTITLKNIFAAFNEEQRRDVLSGDVALYDMLKRAELDTGVKRKKKRQEHIDIPGLTRANRVAHTIMKQRYVSERLMSRHVQPIKPSARQAAKNRFFELISKEADEIDISDLEKLEPPRVTVHTRAARKKDRYPTSIGTSAELNTLSLQRIRASRYLGVNYRDHLTKEEEQIVKLEGEAYDKAIAVLEKQKHYEGLSFKSPVGLPLCRIFDNKIFTRPASFNFTVDLNTGPKVVQPFTYRGVQVTDFKPVVFGSNSLNRIVKDRRTRLAFGYGKLRDVKVIFYKNVERAAEIKAVPVDAFSSELSSVAYQNHIIYYRTALDASPLLSRHHNSETKPYLPGLVGDNEAILNYGFYCRSNQPAGFSIYRKMYGNYNSEMPHFVIKHMPQYPFFPFSKKSVEIERGQLTAFIDYSSVAKLRLVSVEKPKPVVTIELSGSTPRVVDRIEEEAILEDW